MVEDKIWLGLLNEIATELEGAIIGFNKRCNGETDKIKLVTLRMEQNAILDEMVKRHRRAMEYFILGKQVEPMTHFAEGVLIGVGGGEG